MTLEQAKEIVKRNTLYGNENMPIGSSARSYFETELKNFIDGYNKAIEDSFDEVYHTINDSKKAIIKLKISNI